MKRFSQIKRYSEWSLPDSNFLNVVAFCSLNTVSWGHILWPVDKAEVTSGAPGQRCFVSSVHPLTPWSPSRWQEASEQAACPCSRQSYRRLGTTSKTGSSRRLAVSTDCSRPHCTALKELMPRCSCLHSQNCVCFLLCILLHCFVSSFVIVLSSVSHVCTSCWITFHET